MDITVIIIAQSQAFIQLVGRIVGDHSKITLSTALLAGVVLSVAVIITVS